jgi:hypothetical protein
MRADSAAANDDDERRAKLCQTFIAEKNTIPCQLLEYELWL